MKQHCSIEAHMEVQNMEFQHHWLMLL